MNRFFTFKTSYPMYGGYLKSFFFFTFPDVVLILYISKAQRNKKVEFSNSGLKKLNICLPFWPENRGLFFLFLFLFNLNTEEIQYHSHVCVCAFLGMQSPQNWFHPGVGGVVVFHYIWFKCLFGTVTIYSDILF